MHTNVVKILFKTRRKCTFNTKDRNMQFIMKKNENVCVVVVVVVVIGKPFAHETHSKTF